MSGAISGGLLNGWIRGRTGILPGLTTGALACALLQFAYNELDVARIKYVSNKLAISSPTLLATGPSLRSSLPTRAENASPEVSISERIFGWFGFSKVSDEAYLEKLKREREVHLARIAELEKEKEKAAESTNGP